MATHTVLTNPNRGKKIILVLVFFLCGFSLYADQIDIGMFLSATPDKMEIRIRPDFQINAGEYITNIQYTIRWVDPGISINTVDLIPPYNIAKQGATLLVGGYYYQTFICTPMNPVPATINPFQEVVVSTWDFTGGSQSYFQLVNDQYMLANNVQYYAEWNGEDRTGIIYNSYVFTSVPLSNWAVIISVVLMAGTFIFLWKRS
ncbi:MAG TPA: hypothetical protein PK711_07425 [Bacteroidales bacterium]|nr:hypothetical protein [Bacteroidales bacterium]HRZ21065.1 hypothetical protein [Bacteroidales bacterium]